MDAVLPASADAPAHADAGAARLDAVLDLIAEGRGLREEGSGLNAASAELLLADALLTDAAYEAARDGTLDELMAELELERLAARARTLDEAAQ